MHIHYYFCTDLRTNGFIFFSTKGAIITEAFSHTFLHDSRFLNWSVNSPTLLLLLLEPLQLKHCNFVIPTCELWNKGGGFKFGLASWRFNFSYESSYVELLISLARIKKKYVSKDVLLGGKSYVPYVSCYISMFKKIYISILIND